MKGNKIKDIIIIILGLVCVGLTVFIIYDKIGEKNNNTNDDAIVDDNISTNVNEEEKDVVITDISQYPKENSGDILLTGNLFGDLLTDEQRKQVNINTNFKNIQTTINNIQLTYNCTEFRENPDHCEKGYVQFPYMKLDFSNGLGCGVSRNVIYTDNYLLYNQMADCTGDGTIIVYDKYGNSLLTIDNVIDDYSDGNGGRIYIPFRYVNEKLYYISYVDYKTVSFNYVDLSNSAKIEIHNIEVFEDTGLALG